MYACLCALLLVYLLYVCLYVYVCVCVCSCLYENSHEWLPWTCAGSIPARGYHIAVKLCIVGVKYCIIGCVVCMVLCFVVLCCGGVLYAYIDELMVWVCNLINAQYIRFFFHCLDDFLTLAPANSPPTSRLPGRFSISLVCPFIQVSVKDPLPHWCS